MPARRSLDGAGSTTNSPNGCTIHANPAPSNHPTEPFLKGMHNLARGCQAERWLPRVRAPQERFIPEGNAYGGHGFDSAREKDPPRGRAMCLGSRFGPYAIPPPARSPRHGICIPTGLSSVWGPSPVVATCRGNPGPGYASPSDVFRARPYSAGPGRISVPARGSTTNLRQRHQASRSKVNGPRSTVHDPQCTVHITPHGPRSTIVEVTKH